LLHGSAFFHLYSNIGLIIEEQFASTTDDDLFSSDRSGQVRQQLWYDLPEFYGDFHIFSWWICELEVQVVG